MHSGCKRVRGAVGSEARSEIGLGHDNGLYMKGRCHFALLVSRGLCMRARRLRAAGVGPACPQIVSMFACVRLAGACARARAAAQHREDAAVRSEITCRLLYTPSAAAATQHARRRCSQTPKWHSSPKRLGPLCARTQAMRFDPKAAPVLQLRYLAQLTGAWSTYDAGVLEVSARLVCCLCLLCGC